MDLDAIQQHIRGNAILTTAHALLEAIAENIELDDVWASIASPSAELVEDYPSDPRGPSCLILSSIGGRSVHSVVAYPAIRLAATMAKPSMVVLVTVYRPDNRPNEWSSDYRQRRPGP